MVRRLSPLILTACLWGCHDSALPPEGTPAAVLPEAAALPEEAQVAQLLAENVPFEFDFDLEDVNGQRLSKTEFTGQVLIVHIWGVSCASCRMEIPHLIALKNQYGDQGLKVMGLSEEQVGHEEAFAQVVRGVCNSEGMDYPCALITKDFEQQIANFEGVPTTLFLDRKGAVRLKAVGYRGLPFLQAVVETLLQEEPPGGAAPPAETNAQPVVEDGQ
jgi:thiol-disulfide isomerase/thioredoxin